MTASAISSVCGSDRTFDHYARLVRRVLDVPTSTVSIVEPRRQVFAGASGLAEPYATTRETPLSHSFCKHVVAHQQPLVVADAREDQRVADNLAILDLDVIAYAGWPVHDQYGRTVGSLCAIDSKPRTWSDDDLLVLQDLALACSAELQQSRYAAEESENLARTIFGSVDVAMAFFDVDQGLVLANELAEKVAESAGFRLDRPPFAGDQVREADNVTPVPPEDQVIPRALRGDHQSSGMQWIGPPGRQLAVVGSSREVLHADGRRWGTLVAAYDVTRLARSLQVKDEFITTVSHELRTPLTSIIGYLELLADELAPTGGTTAKALDVIERNALNLKRRIGELLDTADRRRHLVVASTDLSELVRRVLATFQEQARAAGIELRVQAQGPQWADVDARRVEQAVENLVSNGLKFTAACGRVTVSVTGRGRCVELAVTDTGVGMTQDEVVQALESFWRADSTRQAAVQGIGIGLTVVQGIVDAHGGSIDVRSRPSEGTTVTLTLPRSPDSSPV